MQIKPNKISDLFSVFFLFFFVFVFSLSKLLRENKQYSIDNKNHICLKRHKMQKYLEEVRKHFKCDINFA